MINLRFSEVLRRVGATTRNSGIDPRYFPLGTLMDNKEGLASCSLSLQRAMKYYERDTADRVRIAGDTSKNGAYARGALDVLIDASLSGMGDS